MINISIDVTKIDKSKIKQHTNGAKYYSLAVDNLKTPDKFGNTHTVYESQSKEERAAKTPKKYIGSGKEFVFNNQPAQQQQNTFTQNNAPAQIDDVPF